MKAWSILLCLLISWGGTLAGDGRDEPKYPVSDIPDALLENAHVVVRNNLQTFRVESRSETVHRIEAVYTILDQKGEDYAFLYRYYDQESKITEFSAYVYDASGELVGKLKKSDIKDVSAVSGFSLYEDSRAQYADMKQPDFPYTVEFVTEVVYKKYYFIPNFQPISSEDISVQKSTFRVVAHQEFLPRFKEVNFTGQRRESLEEGKQVWTWEVSSLKAVKAEPMSRGLKEIVPYVELAPGKFEYSGYKGDMSSWESFGEFFTQLNEGRSELPEKTLEEVRKITDGLSPKEKVKAVYEYMQNRTRYVSIQLGIGGLQPFEASVVDQMGYGDCKALSNYTMSLLKGIGIESLYTLVEAGSDPTPVSKDFSSDPFNHVILCVPMEKDTVWLECTSQTNPFNYLGTFTSDRNVLLITENGGKLVRTPKYDIDDNVRVRKATIEIAASGHAQAQVETHYKGLQYDLSGISFKLHEGTEEQKKWVHRNTEISNYDLHSFTMSNDKSEVPTGTVKLRLGLQKYASTTGKRFYFVPNLMSRLVNNMPAVEERTTPFIREYDLAYVDTIEYNFPSNYQIEYLPDPVSVKSTFGNYQQQTEFIQGKLIYTRRLELFSGEYGAEQYGDFLKFLGEVESGDKTKVVLITKT